MLIYQTLLKTLRREMKLALLIFYIVAAVAVASAYIKDPVYRSSAKMLLNFDSRPISTSGGETPPSTPVIQASEVLTTLTEVMKSEGLIERLIDRVGEDTFAEPPSSNLVLRLVGSAISGVKSGVSGLLASLALIDPVSPRQKLVEDIAQSLSVFAVRQSQVVELAFEWDDAEIPPLVLREFLNIFQERVAEMNAQAVEETLLGRQADLSAQAIDAAQKKLQDLRTRTGIVDPQETRQYLARSIQNLQFLLASDAETGWVTVAKDGLGSEMAALRKQISDFKIEQAGLLSSFTTDSPELMSVSARLDAAEAELTLLRKSIEAALAQHKAALNLLMSVEQDFARAQRELDLASESFRTYSLAAADRRVMRLGDEELRLKVIDYPAQIGKFSGTSRLMSVFAGLIAAALIAAFTVLARDRLTVVAPKPEQRPREVFRAHARSFAEKSQFGAQQPTPLVLRSPGSKS